jgi:hypothetical protein
VVTNALGIQDHDGSLSRRGLRFYAGADDHVSNGSVKTGLTAQQ